MKIRYIVKRILLIMAVIGICSIIYGQGAPCCPEFYIVGDGYVCPDTLKCQTSDPEIKDIIPEAACKKSSHTYTVYPNNQPLYTYEWTVTGGLFNNNSIMTIGNPVVVNWGNGTRGFLSVTISGNGCLETISMEVCLLDKPEAAFDVNPGQTVCLGGLINFANHSINATDYFWDFGDGTYSTLENPSHVYNVPGDYEVILTAYDNSQMTSINADVPASCGCRDTTSLVIRVNDGTAPDIRHVCLCNDTLVDCEAGTICPGDTSYVYAVSNCPQYTWSVEGGSIIEGDGTECIAIKWDSSLPPNTTTTVTLSGCNNGNCPGSITIYIPVLHNQIPIIGNPVGCQNTPLSFSLPTLPGTKYVWSVSNSADIIILYPDQNNETFTITSKKCGKFTISCAYHHPQLACEGLSEFEIEILPSLLIQGVTPACTGDSPYPYNTIESCNSTGVSADWEIVPPSAGSIIGSSTGSNIEIKWDTPGTHTLVAHASNPAGYCNPNASLTVEVFPQPILNDLYGKIDCLCPNRNYTYSVDSDTDNGMYNWSISGGQIMSHMGAYNDSIVVMWDPNPSVSHELSVSQTNDFGCISDELKKTILFVDEPLVIGDSLVCSDTEVKYTLATDCLLSGVKWKITDNAGNLTDVGTIIDDQGTGQITILWNWHDITNQVILQVETCTGIFTHPITIIQMPPKHYIGPFYKFVCSPGSGTHTISVTQAANPPSFYKWWHHFDGTLTDVTSIYPSSPSDLTVDLNSLPLGVHKFFLQVGENCVRLSNISYVEVGECGTGSGAVGEDCPIVSSFSIDNCTGNNIQNSSFSTDPMQPIIGYQWEVLAVGHSGTGSFLYPTAQNPGALSVDKSGTYRIQLTAIGDSCFNSLVRYVSIFLTPQITHTSPACVGKALSFESDYTNSNFGYTWTFEDDNVMSNLVSPQHAWNSPGTYDVNFSVTDGICIANETVQITVHDLNPCSIMFDPETICPDDSIMITACPGNEYYEWFKDSISLGLQIQNPNLYAKPSGYYYVSYVNNFGCISNSNEAYLYTHQLPVANIKGQRLYCVNSDYSNSFSLNTHYSSNYEYQWHIIDPISSNISINNANAADANFTVPSSAWPGTQSPNLEILIEVLVTDIHTGCSNRDTACINLFRAPKIEVDVLNGCVGSSYTFSVNTGNSTSGLNYLWNNGTEGPTITTAQPGPYLVTGTDPETGCSATAYGGEISSLPDLSLFPTGCDTICVAETIDLFLPLPNTTSTYTINWYMNEDYTTSISTGTDLPFSSSNPGDYFISVIVSDGKCQDTAGIHCIHVIPCEEDPCSCDESGWNTNPTMHWILPGGGTDQLELPCNSNEPIDLECRKDFFITAEYLCIDPSCSSTDINIVLPDNTVIGQVAGGVNFGTLLPGYYYFNAYGYCGDVLCDSCSVTFYVHECPPPDYCCHDKDIHISPQVEVVEQLHPHLLATINDNIMLDYADVKSIRASIVNFEIVGFNYPDCQQCQIDESNAGIFEKTGIAPIGTLQYNSSKPQGNREIIWGSGLMNLQNGAPISYKIKLPSTLDIECCDVEYNVCIKYAVEDVNCNICDTTICINISTIVDDNCNCNCDKNEIFINKKPVNNEVTTIKITNRRDQLPTYLSTTCLCMPQNCTCSATWTITTESYVSRPVFLSGKDVAHTFSKEGLYKVVCTISCDGNIQCTDSTCIKEFLIKVDKN